MQINIIHNKWTISFQGGTEQKQWRIIMEKFTDYIPQWIGIPIYEKGSTAIVHAMNAIEENVKQECLNNK